MKEWAPIVGKAKKPKSDKFYSDDEEEKEEEGSESSGSEDSSSSSSSSSGEGLFLFLSNKFYHSDKMLKCCIEFIIPKISILVNGKCDLKVRCVIFRRIY